MLSRQEVLSLLEEISEDLRKLGVVRLSLFGSYARDEQTAGSDLDFLVEFAQGRGLFDDYVAAKRLLEEVFGREVDLVKKHLVREELREEILGGEQIEAKI